MGYDSDAKEAEGEVGRVGVPISSLADMAVLVDGLPLADVSTSMTINATAPILLALYVAAAESHGVERAAISGTTQNDILKEYIARGTYIFPPRPSMRLVTESEFCAAELPKWNTISISGYHMREAGATAAQELAHPADAIAYVEAAVARGLDVDAFAGACPSSPPGRSCSRRSPSSGPLAGCGRRSCARFGVTDPRSWVCRFHVQTAGSSRPPNRSTTTSSGRPSRPAAVLGGAQSLHIELPRRGPGAPDRAGRPAALRTQQTPMSRV
jgi:methylmalonyl-CoA mutase N-terminal domain/subunit